MDTDLEDLGIQPTQELWDSFRRRVYIPYFEALIANASDRFADSDLILGCASIFNPQNLPNDLAELRTYGNDQQGLQRMLNFYGQEVTISLEGVDYTEGPVVNVEDATAEWVTFRRLLTAHRGETMQEMFMDVYPSRINQAMFPNILKLVAIYMVMPFATATVERSFSDMKTIKTRLRNALSESTLDELMRIAIEGPATLSEEDLDEILQVWQQQAEHSRRIKI